MRESPIIEYSPIGYIRTPFREKKGTPIQSCYSNVEGQIEFFPEYVNGLDDLDSFSHLQLIYHFHQSDSVKMKIIPFLNGEERGIFATRGKEKSSWIRRSLSLP